MRSVDGLLGMRQIGPQQEKKDEDQGHQEADQPGEEKPHVPAKPDAGQRSTNETYHPESVAPKKRTPKKATQRKTPNERARPMPARRHSAAVSAISAPVTTAPR